MQWLYTDEFILKCILNLYQCAFGKCYSAQHFLLAMLEKWKQVVSNGQAFGALLTDLSKVLDHLQHELLIAKFNAFIVLVFETDE